MQNNIMNPHGMPVTSIEPGDLCVLKGWKEGHPTLTVLGAVNGGGYMCAYWSESQGAYLQLQAAPAALERAPNA